MSFSRKQREKIIRDYTQRHGGVYRPADFLAEVEAQGESHPAYQWFEWNDDEAAHRYRVDQAREFARNIRVVFSVEEFGGGRVRVREVEAPFMVSPLEDRNRRGGYYEVESGNPEHLAELCGQAARDLDAWRRRYASAVIGCGGQMTQIEHLIAQLRRAAQPPRDEAA